MRKIVRLYLCLYTIVCLSACQYLYKAGNLVYLGFPIETRLNFEVMRQYSDTLITRMGYGVPEKWSDKRKLVDIDSINNIRFYFQADPEEMYLVSFNGVLLLADVYNEKIRNDAWVAIRDSLLPSEEKRIMKRFQVEVLDVIERLAKQDGLPDSVVYKNKSAN